MFDWALGVCESVNQPWSNWTLLCSYSSAWWIISALTFQWKWLWQSDRQVERHKGNACGEARHSRNVRHGNCWWEVAESSVANSIPWILWCPSNSFTVVGFTELTVTARKRFFSSLLHRQISWKTDAFCKQIMLRWRNPAVCRTTSSFCFGFVCCANRV